MKNLEMLRKNQNLTQQEVAEKIGIKKNTYWSYETERTEPSQEILIKLADFFGCSVDYLLGHETKDLIYASGLSAQQTKIINKVKSMTDDELFVLEGVIIRLEEEKQNPWLKNKNEE